MDDKFEFVPNAFYDLIVFTSSTVTFGVGWGVGLGVLTGDRISEARAFDVVLIIAGVLIFGYEYGRIAEAWSSVFVQSPLRFLGKHTRFFRSADFCSEHPSLEADLKLSALSAARPGGKWAAYFYAMVVDPRLGTDLLKRYAWEKLSRNSGFTFCTLFLTSLTCAVLRVTGINLPFQGHWTFGTARFTAVSAALVILTYYEYYRRNCWNYDLIRRVLPVLERAEELHFWHNHRLVLEEPNSPSAIPGRNQSERPSSNQELNNTGASGPNAIGSRSEAVPPARGANKKTSIAILLLGLAWILSKKK